MTTQTVFGSKDQSGATQGKDSSNNEDQETGQKETTQEGLLATLVGEGKKYKSPEDLAKAYANADMFIENLKRENTELKEDLTKRLSAEQILEEIKRTGSSSEEQSKKGTTDPLLADESKILNLVDKHIEGKRREENRIKNILEADKAVKDVYGEKAQEVVARKAADIGVSMKFLEDAAAQSPKAFLSILGIDVQSTKGTAGTPGVSKGTVNTQTVSNNTSGAKVGTWGYYQDLRKQDPHRYFTPKVQNEIMAKRLELGDKFYS